jgi:hypothetical protein
MNIVFLSPHFPSTMENFVVRLAERGHTVLGIADVNAEQLSPRLRAHLTLYYKVNFIEDYRELYKALAYLSFSYGKIDVLESHNEHYLDLEAALRLDFNVRGLKPADLARIKSKAAMKQVLQAANIATVDGERAESLTEALKHAKRLGYPVVAKPDVGVGAAHTRRINTVDELKSYFDQAAQGVTFLEPFIEGEIHTFDGLVDAHGRLIYTNSFIFPKGVMETVNRDLDSVYYNQKKIPADLSRAGRAILQAFDLRERFFHIEFFRTADQKLLALELNARPPGGISLDLFNYANDFDIYQMYAAMISGDVLEAHTHNTHHILYLGLKHSNANQRVHSVQTILDRYGSALRTRTAIPDVFASAIGNDALVFKDSSLARLLRIAAFATQGNEVK